MSIKNSMKNSITLTVLATVLIGGFSSISAQDGEQRREQEREQRKIDTTSQVQSEISIGVMGVLGFHQGSFAALPPVENCCTGYEGTTGFGYGAQLTYLLPLGDGVFALQPRLSWQALPASFSTTSTQKIDVGEIKSGDGIFQHDLDVTWSTIGIGLQGEVALLDRVLHVGLGAEGLFVLSGSYQQTETLTSPSNVVFKETGTNVRDNRSGSLEQYESMLWNITGSVRAQLYRDADAAMSGIDLFARYALPLTPLYATGTVWRGVEIDYRLSYLAIGVAVVF